MIKLIKKIIWYFEGKSIWKAKMREPMEITIISTPEDEQN